MVLLSRVRCKWFALWSGWCLCYPIISCFIKIHNSFNFGTQVVLEKRLLSGYLSVCKLVMLTAKQVDNSCDLGWISDVQPGKNYCSEMLFFRLGCIFQYFSDFVTANGYKISVCLYALEMWTCAGRFQHHDDASWGRHDGWSSVYFCWFSHYSLLCLTFSNAYLPSVSLSCDDFQHCLLPVRWLGLAISVVFSQLKRPGILGRRSFQVGGQKRGSVGRVPSVIQQG